MTIRTSITTLCCGYNGTGYSVLVSIESISAAGEVLVLNRCLVNVGDGTVRFCKENKVKLSGISCILVTSLAPHSISGFAGIFLSLSDMGAGKLTVVGPPGLKSYIELMTPFINRRYPELQIIEIDLNSTVDELQLSLNYMNMHFMPVFSPQSPSRVIALAASIVPSSSVGITIPSSKRCLVIPIAYYFELNLSYVEYIQWGVSIGHDPNTSLEGENNLTLPEDNNHMVLFMPLAVGSYERTNTTCIAGSVPSEIQAICSDAKVCGVLFSGNMSSEMCEFRYCQSTLALLNTVCKPLFPGVLNGLQIDLDSRSLSDDQVNGSAGHIIEHPGLIQTDLSYEPLPLFSGAAVLPAVPLLNFSSVFLNATHTQTGKSCGDFTVQQPLSRNKQLIDRCTSLKSLYNAAIQPNLDAIIAGTYVRPSNLASKSSGSAKMEVSLGSVSQTDDDVSASNHSAASQLRSLIKSNKRKLSSKNLLELDNQSRPFVPSLSTLGGYVGQTSLPPMPPFSYSQETSPLRMEDFNSTGGSLSLSVDTEALQHLDINSVQPSPYNFSNSTLNSARYNGNGGSVFDYSESEIGDDNYSYRSSGSSTALTSPTESVMTSRTTVSSSFFNSPIRSIQEERKKSQRHYFEDESVCEAPQSIPLHHFMANNNIPPPNPMQDLFRITFLGTGCATPSKHRNNSSILLSLKGTPKLSVLLDVGESTAAQLFQSVCGDVNRYDAILLSIRVIWISHHHADHIVGLPQLIEQIKRAHLRAAVAKSETSSVEETFLNGRIIRSKYDTVSQYQKVSQYTDSSKIMLIASESIMKYFEFSLCVAGLDDLVTFYPIASTLYAGSTTDVSLATNGTITRLRSIPVNHCHSSYGVVLDFATRHKVVYSGDCRPSQSLVKAGMECDLLIHEATFDDTMTADALKKKHSTTSEARSIGVQMKARSTILTHFSQRYPIVPVAGSTMNQSASSDLSNSGLNGISLPATNCSVGFDFLNFSFPSQIKSLPKACEDVVKILSAIEVEKEAIRQG